MRYQCVQCDVEFTAEADDERPRCPKCLRQHGLRKLAESAKPSAKSGSRAPLVPIAAALVAFVAAAGGGYAYWQKKMNVVVAADLAHDAETAGVDAGALVQLMAAEASVEDFAEQAAGGADALAKARAVAAALAQRSAKQAFVRWSMFDTRERPAGAAPLSAAGTLAAISKDGARAELYPLETTALAVAALRSQDVAARVVEVFRYPGERAPLDPSGRIGYFAVALLGTDGKVAHVVDVHGARTASPAAQDYTLLSDAAVLGAALSLRALHAISDAQAARAITDADAAIKLAPQSPSVRSAHAAILIATGGAEQGARELEAAAQLRGDAPRRNNLAVLAIAKGDAERAAKETALALTEAPDFASAHLTLASVHLSRGERDLGEAELRKADALEPNLASVAMAWAELYASGRDLDRATVNAERAVRLKPKNPETHLVLARVHRMAGRYDAMRVEARKVLELATLTDRSRVEELIKNVLGPTALEVPTSAELTDEGAVPSAPNTLTLGGPQAGAPQPGGLQLGGGEPKLRLGGGDGQLKLKLNP